MLNIAILISYNLPFEIPFPKNLPFQKLQEMEKCPLTNQSIKTKQKRFSY